MRAATLELPGGPQLRILIGPGYPAAPPLAFLEWQASTRPLDLFWRLEIPAATRLVRALRHHIVGPRPYRPVYGPSADCLLTESPGVAAAQGWKLFLSGAPLRDAELAEGLFARSSGMLARSLANKQVMIVGLGSGGSYVATQLVRAGVGSVTLVDPDQVEPANLSRTTYRAEDLDLAKVQALSRQLRGIQPALRIRGFDCTLGDLEPANLASLIAAADLVLPLTDDPSAQGVLNHLCWQSGTPAVFASLYAGARAGEVILSVPGETRCYQCSTGGIRAQLDPSLVRDADYGTGRLAAEIALGCDIQHLDSATTKLALALLCRGTTEASLGHFLDRPLSHGWSFLALSMHPDTWIFPQLLRDVPGQHAYHGAWFAPAGDPECPVCGDTAHFADADELSAAVPVFDPETLAALKHDA